MILTSLHERSARGSAAETAARPPTRTKSSISVVTNKTFNRRPRSNPQVELCKIGSSFVLTRMQRSAVRSHGRVSSLSSPRHLGSRRARNEQDKTNKTEHRGAPRMTIADNDEGNLTRSVEGLRVLDFSTTIAGPHCTRMLADMGGEVIKIETAEGETMRTRAPMRNN